MKKVLAIQLPARCPFNCSFCRTPDHNTGNPEMVLEIFIKSINATRYDELYLTSNGETGLSDIFGTIIAIAAKNNIPVSVLCATERSIVAGLKRVEISFNEFTRTVTERAIIKAKQLNIPVVLSLVDDGFTKIDPKKLIKEFLVAGILVRSLQAEGNSTTSAGESSFIISDKDNDIGIFPVIAYRELIEFGETVDCIDHFGKRVKLLGAA